MKPNGKDNIVAFKRPPKPPKPKVKRNWPLIVLLCVLFVIAFSKFLSAQEQSKVENPTVAAIEGRPTKAITGDRVIFLGSEMRLEGLDCPHISTEDGRKAKALLNTFLRRPGYLRCKFRKFGAERLATCVISLRKGLAGKDVAEGMRESKLCRWVDDKVTQLLIPSVTKL